MIESAAIKNPKRTLECRGLDSWYPYYAGYSSEFVTSILNNAGIKKDACILDPWNGSGTTTTVANHLGFKAIGYDLNPAMVIAAKSCLVSAHDYSSLIPLGEQIVDCAFKNEIDINIENSLSSWFRLDSGYTLKKMEVAIQKILVDSCNYTPISECLNLDHISSISAFFYVALFRATNKLLHDFRGSNPTWIKIPKKGNAKKAPSPATVSSAFLTEVKAMLKAVELEKVPTLPQCAANIKIASSCNLPQEANTIDYVITSPPYCTRIDYAMATAPELTLLGYDLNTSFDQLRRKLIGTSTVPKDLPVTNPAWGDTCLNFLNQVYNHSSKASKSYYYKSHLQYFDSIYSSLSEVARVLKPDGVSVFVVQDSHYKEIHNNLPLIYVEMASAVGLDLVREDRFPTNKNMAKRNPEVKKYRTKPTAEEAVLCFRK